MERISGKSGIAMRLFSVFASLPFDWKQGTLWPSPSRNMPEQKEELEVKVIKTLKLSCIVIYKTKQHLARQGQDCYHIGKLFNMTTKYGVQSKAFCSRRSRPRTAATQQCSLQGSRRPSSRGSFPLFRCPCGASSNRRKKDDKIPDSTTLNNTQKDCF